MEFFKNECHIYIETFFIKFSIEMLSIKFF